MLGVFGRELRLGTRNPRLKVYQFRPFRHNRDAPLLFVQCAHPLFELLPLFRWYILSACFQKLRRYPVNNLDTGTATHQ